MKNVRMDQAVCCEQGRQFVYACEIIIRYYNKSAENVNSGGDMSFKKACVLLVISAFCYAACDDTAAQPANPVGVVSHLNLISDKGPDISTLEAWKKSFIKEGMS